MSLNTYRTPSGNTGLEAVLRAIQEDLRRLKICEGANIKVEQTTRGQVVTALVGKGGGAASPVTMFMFKSQTDEYLVCREYDGTDQGETDVLIAKDYDLRVSRWNGQTFIHPLEASPGATRSVLYTKIASNYRSAVSAGVTEFQAIRPQYIADKSVIAAFKPSNGTGISGVTWMEANTSRAFTKIG